LSGSDSIPGLTHLEPPDRGAGRSLAWRVWRDGANAAAVNMARDEALLRFSADIGQPVIRFYSWSEPAATFGYFQRIAEIESWTTLRPLIRRPTGGGLVPHDADWTYSVVFPPGSVWHRLRAEESYRRLHDWICRALNDAGAAAHLSPCCAKELPGRCFAGAEKHDVIGERGKIAGAAQRRNKLGLLIQGSVQPAAAGTGVTRDAWERALLAILTAEHGTPPADWTPPADYLARAEELAARYASPEHNRLR